MHASYSSIQIKGKYRGLFFLNLTNDQEWTSKHFSNFLKEKLSTSNEYYNLQTSWLPS